MTKFFFLLFIHFLALSISLPSFGQGQAEGVFTYQSYIIDEDLTIQLEYGGEIVVKIGEEGFAAQLRNVNEPAPHTEVIRLGIDSMIKIDHSRQIIQIPSPELKANWMSPDHMESQQLKGTRSILGYLCHSMEVVQTFVNSDLTISNTIWYTTELPFSSLIPCTFMCSCKLPGFPLLMTTRIKGYDFTSYTEIKTIEFTSIPSETFQGPEGYEVEILHPYDPCNRN